MERPLSRMHLLLLLVLLGVSAGSRAWSSPVPVAASPGASARAFDQAVQQLDRDKFTLAPELANQRLAQLRALLPPADRARGLQYQAQHCFIAFRTAPAEGVQYAQHGQQQARAAGEQATAVRFHYCEAMHRDMANSPSDSLASFNAGIAVAQRIDAPELLAEGLTQRGNLHSFLGDQAQALVDLLAAKALFEKSARQQNEEELLLGIAIAWRRMGELDQSLSYLQQARQAAERNNNTDAGCSIQMQTGYVHYDAGRYSPAQAAFRHALELAREFSDRSDVGAARIGLADTLTRLGQPREALAELSQARADFAAVGDGSYADSLALARARAHAALGQHAAALEDYRRAETLLQANGNERYRAILYQARSASFEALGQTAEALADLRRHVQLRQTLDARTHSEQTQLLRHQFEAERRDLDNRRLQAEKNLREQQVASLEKIRYWQHNAITLGALLVVVLLTLILRQIRRMRRLHTLALTDPLTEVANRRSILLFGEGALTKAQGAQTPLAAFALDIDHFKRINDTHGHAVGDVVLTRVARACQAALRQFDRLGRIGGEEFLVLLPNSDIHTAARIAERLRRNVEALDLSDLAPQLRVTVSVGLAELSAEDALLEQLVQRADLALYRAKAAGRNRVESAQAA